MTHYAETIEKLQRKFYQYGNNFNHFEKIDKQREQELKDKYSYLLDKKSKNGLDTYYNFLSFLVNNIEMHLLSFDERLYLLISYIDPELITFKEYLKSNIKPSKQFEDLTEQLDYDAERKIQISLFTSSVRKLLGFYDERLIKYEDEFFNKFYNTELLKNINKDYSATLLQYIVFISNFSSITKERLTELELSADNWLKAQQSTNIFATSTFNILFQSSLLNLNNLKEQYIFLILVNDRNLKALGIHEEESKIANEKKRCIEELGFYNPDFIKLEQLYYDTFYPDLKVSPFTVTKKR